MKLPRSQVFVFDERLGNSHWVDHVSHARSLNGLIKQLQQGVRAGTYLGYRLIHVYWERLGFIDAPTEDDFREPFQPRKSKCEKRTAFG